MTERPLTDRYRLENRIGQGGMAIVYAGLDTVLRRRVAVKLLREQLADDDEFVERFYSEAHHAAKLSHPNIVNVYDVGRKDETYFIVMELIEGETLATMLRGGALPEAVAIDFAAQIASGLAYAHRQGILHRDVKPANVLVTKDDVVKISDFGIARATTTQTMTQAGIVMGSVSYLSPEQAQGLEIGPSSDLYSLGVVLYEMLAGRAPFDGDSAIAVALKHVSQPAPRLETDDGRISPALAAIVDRLLQKNPADRYASAADVAKALREARERPSGHDAFETTRAVPVTAAPRTIPNPKPRPAPFPDRPHGRHEAPASAVVPAARRSSFAIGAIVLALAIVAGYAAVQHGRFFAPAHAIVPAVVGRSVDDAQRALDKLGFPYDVVETSSRSVAAHRVLKQDPAAGTSIAQGSLVHLVVSSGLPTVALADLRNFTSDDAQRLLRSAQLVPKLRGKYDQSPPGTVLGQTPAAGAALAIGSTVVLDVSKGPQPVAVPDVVSLTTGDATKALAERGLKLVVSERDPSDQIPADVVTSENPQAGSQTAPGSTVSVAISSGAPHETVPPLVGKSLADALAAIGAANLQYTIEYVVDPTAAQGTVLKQVPDATGTVSKGDSIALSVAVEGVVPDVTGKGVPEATALLHDAGYAVGNTAYVQEGAPGNVVRTEPAAGSELRPGETVSLYVNGTSP